MNRNYLITRVIEYFNVFDGDTNVHNVFVDNNICESSGFELDLFLRNNFE